MLQLSVVHFTVVAEKNGVHLTAGQVSMQSFINTPSSQKPSVIGNNLSHFKGYGVSFLLLNLVVLV